MWNKKIEQFKRKNKSFTLIEVIIAIFLLTTGIFGAYTVIQQTIINASISNSKLTAAYLAQEGIEIIRNIRDTNWLENTSWDDGLVPPAIDCSTGCEADYTISTLTSYSTGRLLYIDIDDIDGDGVTNFYRYINSPGSNDIQTKFKRKITILSSGTNLEVLVNVFWQEGTVLRDVSVQENFYDWR